MGSSRIERLIIGRGGKLNGKFGKILYFFFFFFFLVGCLVRLKILIGDVKSCSFRKVVS